MSSIRRRWFIEQPGRDLQQLPLAWSGVSEEDLAEWVQIRPIHGAQVVLTPGGWACVLAYPQAVRKRQAEQKGRKGKR
jgi:hypothetical protein